MRFEGRELKTAASPIRADAVKIGVVYFSLQFVDTQHLVPMVEPLVFIGRDLMPKDEGLLYFQDVESYIRGIRFDSDDKDQAVMYAQPENQISHIFEYERALDLLLVCSLRRQARQIVP